MKNIIWSNEINDEYLNDCRESVAENKGIPVAEVTDNEMWDEFNYTSKLYYDDEKANLNKPLDGRVLCIASLGLWNGTRSGYKIMGANLNEVLKAFVGDYCEVYSDGRNIIAKDAHHDGTNYYTFREIKEDKNIDVLLNRIYDGTASSEDITRYTKSLVPYVNEIYGWGKQNKMAAA